MAIKFCPIASGSSGNSTYLATENTHILIDAGLTGKHIETNLASIHVHPACIDAIFITHEHVDHIKGAGILSRRYDIPIYATYGTWEAIDRTSMVGKLAEKNKRIIYVEENCIVNDMCIRPFDIPHDAGGPVGYTVYAESHKISVATDIGHVTESLMQNIYESTILLLESNHDVDMVRNGSYPEMLKRRILGKRGHLSNVSAGALLTDVMTDKLKYVFLGHLSEENNHPALAYETVSTLLKDKSKYMKLMMAERHIASEIIEI